VLDLIPLDFDFQFTDLIFEFPSYHILVSSDVSTLINTGCMIFRNSHWTKAFLQKWIDQKDSSSVYNEQLGFDFLYKQVMEVEKRDPSASLSLKGRIKILPIQNLNSEAPPMWKQQLSHKVLTNFLS
jgi:hypothetical protein